MTENFTFQQNRRIVNKKKFFFKYIYKNEKINFKEF